MLNRLTKNFMKRLSLIAISCLISMGGARAVETNSLTILTLTQAHELALHNHPQIAAANYRALAAEESVKETRAGYFPTISLNGAVVGTGDNDNTRILAGGLNNPSVYDRVAGGLSLNQLLTDFGRTANLTASSKFSAQAENQNAAATREQVLLQVDAEYFRALEAQAVLHVAEQALATRQLLLEQVNALATNKLKSELDVSFAQVALGEGRLLVEKARNNTDAAMASLSTALGYHQLQSFQLVEQSLPANTATNDASEYVEKALGDRPELLSLRNQHDAATKFARSEKDARLPTVSAVGVVGDSPTHDGRLPDNYAAGGILVSLPIFSGGLYAARQHEAELKAQADDELLRSAENNVIRDVRIAWLNVNNALEQLKTTEELVKHANESFELADARYQTGISSIVELSQAQLSLISAQLANTDARYNVLIEEANLNYQTGTLQQSE
jgi:outer membrane protein